MMNPIGFGLAMAATASLGFAHGEGVGKDDKSPLLDNLFQDGVRVSYKPGSGVTFTADKGDFALNIAGRVQVKWYYSMIEGTGGADDMSLSSFQVRRARTKFQGHVFNEDLTYFLQLEHAGVPDVLDAIAAWRFVNNEDSFVNLSMGLQKTRGGLQSDASSGSLEFIERTIASRTFADKRGTGALVHGGLMKNENGHRLHWHFGAFNSDTAGGTGTAPTASNADSEFMYTLGVLFAGDGLKWNATRYTEGDLEHNGRMQPVVGATITAGTTPDQIGGTSKVQTINVFAGLKTGAGIAAQAEVWIREDEQRFTNNDADSLGWYVQGSYTTKPGEGTQYGIGARWSMVTLDDPNPALLARPSLGGTSSLVSVLGATGDISEGSIGVNAYYHKHKLKSQLNYIYQDVSPDGGGSDLTNHGLDLMFTLAW